jgi:hypothetical protein
VGIAVVVLLGAAILAALLLAKRRKAKRNNTINTQSDEMTKQEVVEVRILAKESVCLNI